MFVRVDREQAAMTREKHFEITIHLDNIHDLFTTPTGDPFSPKVRFVSGIEFIKSEFKPQLLRRGARTRTTIFLPKGHMETDLASKTREALARYCQFKVRQNQNAITVLQWDALKSLFVGILFLIAGRLLLDQATFLPGFLSTLLGYGFDIAFWVLLWRPVDFFLFDLSASWREIKIYQHIMEMEVVVAENPYD